MKNEFILFSIRNNEDMALTCKKHKNCYIRKDRKKCLTPNAWVVFLRTNKNVFTSIEEASVDYHKNFKPVLENLIKVGSKDASAKQKKALFHKAICEYFYHQMKASGKNTASNKKKVSSSVSKVLEQNGIPNTLKIMGATHTAAALAAKEQAMKKAAANVAAKEKTAEDQRRKAAVIIKRAVEAAARARRLKKEADSAKTRKTASNRAKRRADTLNDSAKDAIKRMKKTDKAVTEAKDKANKVAKRKVPRALAGLDTKLKDTGVGRKRTRRR
ncbi:EsV-1-218 [Ectocarpus siliculosus]|uniref:EsV-1-218 n=1 Tax=Ectocarpus siliculosus TaxID=2880 RepID=D8LP36_ECTSI|nr:EsV-1-218 [Ectocarpus siliculosus]|eukprot:CBN80307.1 EsV-1-218 [Ectocarpus siliculosus]